MDKQKRLEDLSPTCTGAFLNSGMESDMEELYT